jgi:hypothetical protein
MTLNGFGMTHLSSPQEGMKLKYVVPGVHQ